MVKQGCKEPLLLVARTQTPGSTVHSASPEPFFCRTLPFCSHTEGTYAASASRSIFCHRRMDSLLLFLLCLFSFCRTIHLSVRAPCLRGTSDAMAVSVSLDSVSGCRTKPFPETFAAKPLTQAAEKKQRDIPD